MSCFIVSHQTLGVIVGAASSLDDYHQLRGRSFGKLGYNLHREEDQERLARDLYEMNVAAFCERYPGENERTRYPEDIPAFVKPTFRSFDIVQAHKSTSCLSYQCSEGDVPDQPLFAALDKFADDLAAEFISKSPQYETALWG